MFGASSSTVIQLVLVLCLVIPACLASCLNIASLSNGQVSYSNPIQGDNTYAFLTVATHACDSGFLRISGDELRACQSDGSWSGGGPSCLATASTCASLIPPPNGAITYSTDTTPDFDPGTTATYSCSNGFGLSGGDTVRTCQGQPIGAWSGSEPTCEAGATICRDIPDPQNGQIIFNPNTNAPFMLGTVATYSCLIDADNAVGFGLTGGDSIRTCISDGSNYIGSWSGTAPTCESITCSDLAAPVNGTVSFETLFKSKAFYTCDYGYRFDSGSRTRTCQGNDISPIGYWDGQQPTCIVVHCEALFVPPNGVITYDPDTTSQYDFATQATYSCHDGYYLVAESSVRTCSESTSFTCTDQYIRSEELWFPNARSVLMEPRCEAIMCMDISDPMNGQITFSPDTLSPFLNGTIASYSCFIDGENRIGYGLNGGNATRTCVGDGSSAFGDWDGTAPTCELIMCPVPDAPLNGFVSFNRNFRRTVSYGCDSMYGFSSGSRRRTCRGTDRSSVGFWDGSEPVCEFVTCGNELSSTIPSNGAITYSTDTTAPFDFGTTATYSCPLDQGYQLVANPSVRTCAQVSDTSRGFWSPSYIWISPRCDYIWCSPISGIPSNVMVTYGPDIEADYVPGTIATLTCSGDGFGITSGNMQRQCGSGRIWSGTTITCGAILCPDIPNPVNGRIDFAPDVTAFFDYATTATYVCNIGFGISGANTTRICEGDGTSTTGVFSGIAPTCEEIMCLPLPVLANGQITYSTDTTPNYDFTTEATYSCNSDFSLLGDVVRTCGGDGSSDIGTWRLTEPTCELITCPSLPDPDDGQVIYSTSPLNSTNFEIRTTASYSCNVGFGITGASGDRTCGGDGSSVIGVWDGSTPTCEPIMCPDLVDPANGQINFSPDSSALFDFGTTATYTCLAGFGLVGEFTTRMCDGDGTNTTGVFSGISPTCEEIMCLPLPVLANGQITYSTDTTPNYELTTEATYSCNQNFSLVGDVVRTCGGDGSSDIGTWSLTEPTCESITCPSLPDPDDGQVIYSTSPLNSTHFETRTTANYSCNVGFGITGGSGDRTCGGDGSSVIGVWDGSAHTCEPIMCPDLVDPTNGQINFSPDSSALFDFGTTATYTCLTEFGLVGGFTTRICGGDGTSTTGVFSGIAPTCEEIMCLPLPVLANGQITYSTDTTPNYDFTTEATYSCNQNFSLVGDVVRTCGGDGSSDIGTWSLTEPTCESITCPSLPDPDNGQVMYSTSPLNSTNFEIRTTASYSCNVGFGITGASGDRTCGGDGSSVIGVWDGSAHTCEPIMCPDLVDPTNGQINFSPDSSALFDLGTTATYTCLAGFGLVGGFTTRICSGDGTSTTGVFSGIAPTCEEIMCLPLPVLANGQITYSTDTIPNYELTTEATYSCNQNFSLVGDVVRTCGGDGSSDIGTWSLTEPTCELAAIVCSELPFPANGRVAYSNNTLVVGITASYICDIGYGLSGGVEGNRTCYGSGSSSNTMWSGEAPTCELITCPRLAQPENGSITYNSTTMNASDSLEFDSTATYICDSGFRLIGGETMRTCDGNGTSPSGEWTGDAPTCQPYSLVSTAVTTVATNSISQTTTTSVLPSVFMLVTMESNAISTHSTVHTVTVFSVSSTVSVAITTVESTADTSTKELVITQTPLHTPTEKVTPDLNTTEPLDTQPTTSSLDDIVILVSILAIILLLLCVLAVAIVAILCFFLAKKFKRKREPWPVPESTWNIPNIPATESDDFYY